MKTAALIVAAGRGQRAGGGVPKQWRDLNGTSIAQRSVDAFTAHPAIDHVVLVAAPDTPPDMLPSGAARVVDGGATRSQSVRNGLEALDAQEITHVLIHDAARPLVPRHVIDAVLDALGTHDGAAPALPVVDALWTVEDGTVAGVRDRDGLFRAQTPQGFALEAILGAHRNHPGDALDDVGVARAAGLDVVVVTGDERNMKVTAPEDFARAADLARKGDSKMDVRTGTGYDVHRFGPGDHVMLCGVAVPHERGLQGHSDADVGMHALTDAIYGALAQGDIGRHFPPTDPQWKGAASHIFLTHACDLAREMGYRISNADVTLICERPKIGPVADAMIAKMAELCSIDPGRMSIKATTSERLGFTGREEGIAAMAAVTLVAP